MSDGSSTAVAAMWPPIIQRRASGTLCIQAIVAASKNPEDGLTTADGKKGLAATQGEVPEAMATDVTAEWRQTDKT
jgi:hypothetical protein